MNSPLPAENLEISRLEKLRAQVKADIESLQEKEQSMRDYEQRLRALIETVPQAQAGLGVAERPASTPPPNANLDAEWEKYQRAHALLEAARRSLTDDRLVLKAREADLLKMEEQLARREAWVSVRERELDALEKLRAEEKASKSKSSFTQAPFLAVKNLLTGEH